MFMMFTGCCVLSILVPCPLASVVSQSYRPALCRLSCLRRRKYMFAIHDDITRLVFMGLAQLGQQMLAKDQVSWGYCR